MLNTEPRVRVRSDSHRSGQGPPVLEELIMRVGELTRAVAAQSDAPTQLQKPRITRRTKEQSSSTQGDPASIGSLPYEVFLLRVSDREITHSFFRTSTVVFIVQPKL